MEARPVFFFTLYRDFSATEVKDVEPGSGAAALAALYNDIPYQGFCHNAAHQQWLHTHLKEMLVAIIGLKKVKSDPEIDAKVEKYLHRAVSTAKWMLPEHVQTGAELGDCFTGGDDSDNEET